MDKLIPSTNLSDQELFRVNGNLPPERIAPLLDHKIDPRNVAMAKEDLKSAMNVMEGINYQLQDLLASVRGSNIERTKEIMSDLDYVRAYLKDARVLID